MKINYYHQSNFGFTLLELIFTLGILVLFLTISIPLFRGPSENNKLILSSEEIKEGILRAHNLSISPDKEKDPKATLYIILFGQFPAQGVEEGFLIYEAGGGSVVRVLERFSLPAGIDFVPPNYQAAIHFSIEQQGKIDGASPISATGIMNIVLKNKLGSTQNVTVDTNTGKIEISNLQRP